MPVSAWQLLKYLIYVQYAAVKEAKFSAHIRLMDLAGSMWMAGITNADTLIRTKMYEKRG